MERDREPDLGPLFPEGIKSSSICVRNVAFEATSPCCTGWGEHVLVLVLVVVVVIVVYVEP